MSGMFFKVYHGGIQTLRRHLKEKNIGKSEVAAVFLLAGYMRWYDNLIVFDKKSATLANIAEILVLDSEKQAGRVVKRLVDAGVLERRDKGVAIARPYISRLGGSRKNIRGGFEGPA